MPDDTSPIERVVNIFKNLVDVPATYFKDDIQDTFISLNSNFHVEHVEKKEIMLKIIIFEKPKPTCPFLLFTCYLYLGLLPCSYTMQLCKEKIVDPNRPKDKPVYYHRRFRRVPTIDECYVDDVLCKYEANEQYKRDRLVDKQILRIMNQRRIECYEYYRQDKESMCKKVEEEYEATADNYFIKYGDLPIQADVVDVYMKQKHRLIWERRQREKGLLKND